MLDLLCCPDCAGPLSPAPEVLRCTSCGAEYACTDGVPRLVGASSNLNLGEVETQDYVSDFYEQHRYGRPWARRYHSHTLDQMVTLAAPEGTVLDLGCGTGVFLEHMLERAGGRIRRYVGLDVSAGMLRYAANRLDRGGSSDFTLVQGDACRLPFERDSFDVVFARGLLHHLPNPAAGVREIHRVLRPGGRVAVLDPNRSWLSDLPRRLARKSKHFDEEHKNFALAELRALLSTDLAIKDVQFVGYVAYPLLGFPDLIDFGRLLPLEQAASALIELDGWIAQIPGLRELAWGVMMVAVKE